MNLRNFVKASVRKVIHVTVREGEGIEGNPVRYIEYFLDLDGTELCMRDKFLKMEVE